MDLPPLSEGNWLQRRYARWAEPHYRRMAPELRQEVERLDRWLYSRRGLVAWAGLLVAVAGTVAALMMWVGMSADASVGLALVCWFTLLLILGGAWLTPDQYVGAHPRAWNQWVKGLLGGVVGMVVGITIAAAVSGELSDLLDGPKVVNALWKGLPWLLAVIAVMWLVTGLVARLSRWRLQVQMRSLQLAAERDAAAREVAEARLRLLQAQIHPHFIFNTLSAVQHWVDAGDTRASPLLRDLTAFLRGATEMLGRERSTLGEEVAMVSHYLSIMQARLGQRLTSRVDVPPELARLKLPPGLLLTLVENAVEHGIEPALAGGCVSVAARADPGTREVTVRVHDDGMGLAPGWQEGVGLANCRQRLTHHFGASGRLDLLPLERGTTALMRWVVPALPEAEFPSGEPT
jgi:signal transduction histidine kinase